MADRVVGVIGGSGLYQIDGMTGAEWRKIDSPWGEPSDELLFGELDGAKLVFINRRGIKVREYDAAGLAQALHDGEVKLIEDGALFDRALEAVISDLRRMQSA